MFLLRYPKNLTLLLPTLYLLTFPALAKLSLSENAFQYSGQYTDGESKLQYLDHRYLLIGPAAHFISLDMINSDAKQLFDNTYNYADDDPINEDDPLGESGTGDDMPGLDSNDPPPPVRKAPLSPLSLSSPTKKTVTFGNNQVYRYTPEPESSDGLSQKQTLARIDLFEKRRRAESRAEKAEQKAQQELVKIQKNTGSKVRAQSAPPSLQSLKQLKFSDQPWEKSYDKYDKNDRLTAYVAKQTNKPLSTNYIARLEKVESEIPQFRLAITLPKSDKALYTEVFEAGKGPYQFFKPFPLLEL